MEDLLDNPYVPAANHGEPTDESTVDDIWQSQAFTNLRDSDHDGDLFFPAKDGEGRLVFSLSVDGFNPFHNKTAKQTVSSSGHVRLTCMGNKLDKEKGRFAIKCAH